MAKQILHCGDIDFELTYKPVKNINLRICRDGRVCISAPKWVKQRDILNFVLQKRDFIQSAKRKLSAAPTPMSVADGTTVQIGGTPYQIRLQKGMKNTALVTDGTICLTLKDPICQEQIDCAFEGAVRQIGQQLLQKLCLQVHPYFAQYCKEFPQIKLRKMVSQWGNCRPKTKVITFSYNLLFCPLEAIQYVVVHEFCHFAHPNHGREFYALLSGKMPDYKERRALLKSAEK